MGNKNQIPFYVGPDSSHRMNGFIRKYKTETQDTTEE